MINGGVDVYLPNVHEQHPGSPDLDHQFHHRLTLEAALGDERNGCVGSWAAPGMAAAGLMLLRAAQLARDDTPALGATRPPLFWRSGHRPREGSVRT